MAFAIGLGPYPGLTAAQRPTGRVKKKRASCAIKKLKIGTHRIVSSPIFTWWATWRAINQFYIRMCNLRARLVYPIGRSFCTLQRVALQEKTLLLGAIV